MDRPEWHKSSYSGSDGGNCVEVAETPHGPLVRDTQNRDAGHLSFSPAEWTALLRDLKG